MSKPDLKAIILAAGKGTRLQTDGSDLPKVMRLAAGKPLLEHVLTALDFVKPENCIIVVGYKKESVMKRFTQYRFAEQKEQLGTGHAVMTAFDALADFNGSLLVCCGDMPLIKQETYMALVRAHYSSGNVCTILSGTSSIDLPYGRILRDSSSGNFCGIVEERDATDEQKSISELNSGVYVFDAQALNNVLSELSNDNAQGEYYLTDAPLLLLKHGHRVGVCLRELGHELLGVNTPDQLRLAEELLQV